jgi:hypothetical protein
MFSTYHNWNSTKAAGLSQPSAIFHDINFSVVVILFLDSCLCRALISGDSKNWSALEFLFSKSGL